MPNNKKEHQRIVEQLDKLSRLNAESHEQAEEAILPFLPNNMRAAFLRLKRESTAWHYE
jgi:hypothetical protein